MLSNGANVLVIGANGYIGNAVARAFVRAGYRTYGLVRREQASTAIAKMEIIPLIGSPEDTGFLEDISKQGIFFSVIVSAITAEGISDYESHYTSTVALLRKLAGDSIKHSIRPLVIITSGCKDYGRGPLDGTPGLEPHTELTPLNPHASLVNRSAYSLKFFENKDLFDTVVVRPTHVYGYSSSFYVFFFVFAEDAKRKEEWILEEDPKTILHAIHVDDCAEAYVSIAKAKREVVAGQCYNISSRRYETTGEILSALVKEYDIKNGIKHVGNNGIAGPREKLLGYSQWVSSDKLRSDTGWTDKRLLFSEGIKQYRLAYEAALKSGDEKITRLIQKVLGRTNQQARTEAST